MFKRLCVFESEARGSPSEAGGAVKVSVFANKAERACRTTSACMPIESTRRRFAGYLSHGSDERSLVLTQAYSSPKEANRALHSIAHIAGSERAQAVSKAASPTSRVVAPLE
jgi:hypothetical protein